MLFVSIAVPMKINRHYFRSDLRIIVPLRNKHTRGLWFFNSTESRRLAKKLENYNPLLGIFKPLLLLGEHF